MNILTDYQIFMLLVFTLFTGNIIGNYVFKYLNKRETVKPIVLVKMSGRYSKKDFNEAREMLNLKLIDYHVIVTYSEVDSPEFKIFYEKDFNKVKYNELKQIIEDSIKEKS